MDSKTHRNNVLCALNKPRLNVLETHNSTIDLKIDRNKEVTETHNPTMDLKTDRNNVLQTELL